MGRALELSVTASVKALLHCQAHPTATCGGLILGKGGKALDAVPLFHSGGALCNSPTLEAALAQVDAYARAKGDGTAVIGYYQANPIPADKEIGAVAQSVGKRIAKNCGEALVLLLDAEGLAGIGGSGEVPFRAFTAVDGKYRADPDFKLTYQVAGTERVVKEHVEGRRERDLVDWDDHLDDLGKDWANPAFDV